MTDEEDKAAIDYSISNIVPGIIKLILDEFFHENGLEYYAQRYSTDNFKEYLLGFIKESLKQGE